MRGTFYNVKDEKTGVDLDISEFLQGIQSGKWRNHVKNVRDGITQKDTLPCFMVSGTFNGTKEKTDIVKPSGSICLDFDGIKGDVEEIKKDLARDPYIMAAFVSCGGKGLATIIETGVQTDRELKNQFPQIVKYFKDKYGLIADTKCKNINRLRFVSHDPEAIIKEHIPFPVSQGKSPDFKKDGADHSDLSKYDQGWKYDQLFSYATWANHSGQPISVPLAIAEAWPSIKDPDSDTTREKAIKCVESVYNTYQDQHGQSSQECAYYEVTHTDTIEETNPGAMIGKEIFIQRGEVGAIVALPGYGKTQVCEAIAAKAIATKLGVECDGLGFSFPSLEGDVYSQDTERPKNDNVRSYGRIAQRISWTGGEKIPHLTYHVLSEETAIDKKRQLLETTLKDGNYSLVIIDGILDYSSSLNDEISAKEAVVWLRSLAVRFDTAIIVTIHPNKGTETIAGHLGAFLYRYCRGMVLIRPTENDKNVREITTDFPQGKLSHGDTFGFSPTYFEWSEEKHMMVSTEAPEKVSRKYDKEILKKTFFSFQSAEVLSKDLKEAYCKQLNIKERTARAHFADAVRDEILQVMSNGPMTKYRLT